MTLLAPSNVESPYTPLWYCTQSARIYTHILLKAMKMHPVVTCWNWAFEGDTSKSSSNTNTCEAETFHKSPEEAELVCVFVCVYTIESSSLVLQEVTSIYLSYIVTYPNAHTHTGTAVQCSIKSWLFIPVVLTLPAEKPERLSQYYN